MAWGQLCPRMTWTLLAREFLPAFNILPYSSLTTARISDNFVQQQCPYEGEQEEIPVYRDQAYYLLRECVKWNDLESCRRVQSIIIYNRLESVPVLANHLISLFAACGSLIEGNEAFGVVLQPNLYTWTAIMDAHGKFGHHEVSLQLYDRMLLSDVKGDKFIDVLILKACIPTRNLKQGRCFHEQIIENNVELDILVGNTLVDMYAKCGSLEEARKVFDTLPNKDVVSWTTMIDGYAKSDILVEACKLFEQLPNANVVSWGALIAGYVEHVEGILTFELLDKMQSSGLYPNELIFSNILKACGSIGYLEQGRCIHEHIIKCNFQLDIFVQTSLVGMYCKCGSLVEALKLFNNSVKRDVALWGAIIEGHAEHFDGLSALQCFSDMQHDGIRPDKVTFLSTLKACLSVGAIHKGRCIHEQLLESDLKLDIVEWNALIDMYATCGSLVEAYKVFEKLEHPDVVSRNVMIGGYMKSGNLQQAQLLFQNLLNPNMITWGTMIVGYTQNGESLLALECFENMQHVGIYPDNVTFSNILKACGGIGAIQQGRYIHECTMECGLEPNIFVGTSLIDMYANCGRLTEAHKIFNNFLNKSVALWNAMIAGYAQVGDVMLACECLESMKCSGIRPDDATFIGLLNACSHAGLVDEGHNYFKSMREPHGITPNLFHYNCMVDLLGRTGLLQDAQCLLMANLNLSGLRALLSACRMHGNMEMGTRCFDEIVSLDSFCAAGYVLMSNICADIVPTQSKICADIVATQ